MANSNLSRREFLALSATVGASALAACSAPTSAPAPASAPVLPTKADVTLRVQGDEKNEAPLLPSFQSKFPHIKLEYVSVTGIDHEEVASKILTMIAAGETLDFGYSATEALQVYAGAGLSQPLDEWVKRDSTEMADFFSEVHPSLVQAMMYEGSLYELPFDFNAANMYINTKLFKDNGIEFPPADWTKDDFVSAARKISKPGDAGKQVYGFGWTNRLWGSWMPWIFANGGNLFEQEEAPGGEWLWGTYYKNDPMAKGRGGGYRWINPVANSPAVVEALQLVVDLYKEGVTPGMVLGSGSELQGLLGDNHLGMTPGGGFWAGGLGNAGFPKGSFDVQLWPKWKNQTHQFGTGGQWMVAASKHKDEVWEYSKHRISKDGMQTWFDTNGIVTTPARRPMLNATAFAKTGPEHWQVFYDTLDKHPETAPIPCPPISNPMTTLFTNYTGQAMDSNLTPQAAMDSLQKELVDLVARSKDVMYPKK